MTAAERLMLRGQYRAEQDWATTGRFTLDGVVGTWSGVISDNQNILTPEAGGLQEDRTITVVASKQQFETAGTSPQFRQRITWRGGNYVITRIDERGDTGAFTITAEQAIKAKK